jgi:hypothetical protein
LTSFDVSKREAYLLIEFVLAGAIAEASFDAVLAAAAAEFDEAIEAFEEAIAALASDAAVLEASAALLSAFLQAPTEIAAKAAPTIMIVRSVAEVMSWSPRVRLAAPCATLARNMPGLASSARVDFTSP